MQDLYKRQLYRMFVPSTFIFLLSILSFAGALDNGLALTPPMGFLTWLRFECTIDCDNKPKECISENLIKRTADLMVSEGYLEAGYQYITIDDCWLEKERGPDGRLKADRKRFPNGMKALAAYVHKKGLIFGIYEDYGSSTCAGYPGVEGHEKIDAETLASWDIDYLKLDGCNTDVSKMNEAYPAFGKLLNETGRSILYACSWPYFEEAESIHEFINLLIACVHNMSTTMNTILISDFTPNYSKVAKHCNIWRNYYDIRNSWSSVVNTMTWFGKNQDRIAPFIGPGQFSDPDMLVIGNSGLTVDQAQVQMAVWAILAAPLMMSVDLAEIKPEFKAILLNRDVIAVNQDELGHQGLLVWKSSIFSKRRKLQVWNRKLSRDCYAIAFVNLSTKENQATFTYQEMRLPVLEYVIQDLFNIEERRSLQVNQNFTVQINKTGVKFYKFCPNKNSKISVILVN